MNYQDLLGLLSGHRVFLQTHNFPDPDAIASAYGLQVFLKAHGIESTICFEGDIEKITTKRMISMFHIETVNRCQIFDMTHDDYVVTVDAQKYNSNITNLPGKEVACVDHHPAGASWQYQYCDIRVCGACASIVTDYFLQSNTPLDENTASALLYGLKMDTDSFNRGVTDFDIQMYAVLNKLADGTKISALFHNTMELTDLFAYADAIKSVKVFNDVGFASISFDCPDALVAMVSDFILCLDVVQFCVVYAARNGGLKFSVRNEDQGLHAGHVTERALSGLGGGGGHASMAGGVIPKDRIDLLGDDMDTAIRNRFLEAIDSM